MTGSPPSALALATQVNRSVEDAIADARVKIERMASIPQPSGPVELKAKIVVADGSTTITSCQDGDFDRASADFRAWIAASA